MFRKIHQALCDENLKLTEEIHEKYKEKIDNSIRNTVKYSDVRNLVHKNPKLSHTCIVEVLQEDTVDAGYFLQHEGYNPMILNMASNTTPGGGWRNGAVAQEESLFYRSLYYLSLEDPWKLNDKSEKFYPLQMYSCIYSPDIFFFRTKQREGYKLLPYNQCCFLSCLAVSAIRNPRLRKDGTMRPSDVKKMKEKIRGIFKVALKHEHDSVVLGALGCGAYGNDPKEIARIFAEVIPEFQDSFSRITFAIIDYGRTKNCDIFSHILKEKGLLD